MAHPRAHALSPCSPSPSSRRCWWRAAAGEEKTDEKTPTEVMETAKKNFDDASSVHIALSTDSTPAAGNGVLGATGDITHDPAFEGDVKVLLRG